MLICNECGTRNDDDERFCSECGAYLEWDGHRVEVPSPTPVASSAPEPVEQDRAPQHPGLLDRIRSATGLTTDDQAPQPSPDKAADRRVVESSPERRDDPSTQHVAPAERAAPAGQTSAPVAPGTPPDESTAVPDERVVHPARRTTPPVEPRPAPSIAPVPPTPDTSGQSAVAAPVLPGASAPRRRAAPVPVDDEPRPAPGDLICGQCGAGNVPTRKFCRRCGGDLADAPRAVRPPWWRRLVVPRARVATPAGTRPARHAHRVPTRTLTWVVVIGLLAGGGWWGRAQVRAWYGVVADRVAGSHAVAPSSLSASSSMPDRGPELAADGATNRSWAPAAPGDDVGESLTATFDHPVRLVYVRIFSGASEQQPEFLAQGRAERVTITVTRSTGASESHQVRLADRAGPQLFRLGISGATSVRLTIGAAYPVPADAHVAVGEVEFLGRD